MNRRKFASITASLVLSLVSVPTTTPAVYAASASPNVICTTVKFVMENTRGYFTFTMKTGKYSKSLAGEDISSAEAKKIIECWNRNNPPKANANILTIRIPYTSRYNAERLKAMIAFEACTPLGRFKFAQEIIPTPNRARTVSVGDSYKIGKC